MHTGAFAERVLFSSSIPSILPHGEERGRILREGQASVWDSWDLIARLLEYVPRMSPLAVRDSACLHEGLHHDEWCVIGSMPSPMTSWESWLCESMCTGRNAAIERQWKGLLHCVTQLLLYNSRAYWPFVPVLFDKGIFFFNFLIRNQYCKLANHLFGLACGPRKGHTVLNLFANVLSVPRSSEM